jgi:hypothetical protein
MKSRMLGLLAFALIGASGSAASMGDDAADPNLPIVYLFWSPILTGTLDGQPFEGQLTVSSIFYGTPPGLLFSIDGVQNGIGGLVDRVSPTEWCSPDHASCISQVPGGLDVQSSRSLYDGFLVESLDITSTATSISYNSVAGGSNSFPPVSLTASGGPGVWEVFVGVPEPSPLALWGAALLVFVLLQRSRIVSKATGLSP